ncbi:MAG: rod shape-determining protein MreD [Thermanaeromonas sp.]|uniref:rod shape-determining protein MreD n=1 Tax=Thermanaeromonas sp. TaxID=2003697 RepID=UPI00243E2195|nr:rod shape-determining protein MreD [Thermanaeromonas sp.]MCG0278154.1 rod shape-determining protein MreD [Thermanaeromonas sp.]
MPVVAFIITGVLSLILEATVLQVFQVAGVKPDLLLILLCFYALSRGAKHGAVLGAFYGLMEDLYLCRFLGMNALIKMLVGCGVGWGRDKLNLENPWVPVTVVWVASVASGFFFLLFAPLGGLYYPWGSSLLKTIFPAALYNASLAFLGESLKREGTEWLANRRSLGG